MALSVDAKRILIEQEQARWERGLYLLEVRARVFKKIGDDAGYKGVVRDMERHQQALDALAEELNGLED